jgi:threonine dehydrogenase-like Zn-dependent dehydrogenase
MRIFPTDPLCTPLEWGRSATPLSEYADIPTYNIVPYTSPRQWFLKYFFAECCTNTQNDNVGVLIVGAGPVGLFTALKLCRAGLPVTVIEKVYPFISF